MGYLYGMPRSDLKREFAVTVVQKLQQAGFTALWAGGCVRDHLLGLEPDDYDVATSATPDQVQQLFGPRRTLAIGASFGVMLVHGSRRAGEGDVEVATFRTEGPYQDGRRPEHVAFSTPEEDAQRRDFTINGMFLDPLSETVFDYVGGKEDLQRRVVRAIGEARARFREDKLRMLRAVRITARFDFLLEEATALAVQEMAAEILVVSQERIAQELKKMLVHPRRSQAVELARRLQLLTVILPELKPVAGNEPQAPAPESWRKSLTMLESLDRPGFELAFATLFARIGAAGSNDAVTQSVHDLCRRLRLSNDERERIAWLVAHRQDLHGAMRMPVAHFKRLMAEPWIGDLVALSRVEHLAEAASLSDVEFCENYLRITPPEEINPPPFITGDNLLALRLKPGPEFKQILDAVRDAQLEGRIVSRDEALKTVRQLLEQLRRDASS